MASQRAQRLGLLSLCLYCFTEGADKDEEKRSGPAKGKRQKRAADDVDEPAMTKVTTKTQDAASLEGKTQSQEPESENQPGRPSLLGLKTHTSRKGIENLGTRVVWVNLKALVSQRQFTGCL